MSDTKDLTAEEIEGLGGEGDSVWGDYPIDTLHIRHEQRTIHDVLRRIGKGSFVMNPDFQRDFIWDKEKQSKLIESVIMRIPLPVFYLAEDTEGQTIVVDGLQRLSTFARYVKNELRLELPNQKELHGKRFEDLSPKLQNRIEDCNLVLYIVDANVPEQARLDIFDRVNSGVPLTRQQMRNALYMGNATTFLKEEASTDLFKQATGLSLRPDSMRDREFVNRFCAFHLLDLESYSDKDKMDGFLARALKHMNQLPTERLDALSVEFGTSLRNNFEVFGRHSFRKHHRGKRDRSVLNASLWDVMSTGLSKFSEDAVRERKEALLDRFYGLMDDEQFIRSITYGPNSAKQVQRRFEVMRRTLQEVFDA